ncbi:putative transcription factor WD40-like family [Helianthus annuus]|nr:putative transcription factor WD40-like family [Helianthus annuus]
MGGVEDNEPPSKRVKASSRELKGVVSNGLKQPSTYSFGASMARPLASQGDSEIIGSKGIKNVRIIAETLYSLGYSKTGAYLEEESGIPFHSPAVGIFIQQILDGNWDPSLTSLRKVGITDESIVKSAITGVSGQRSAKPKARSEILEELQNLLPPTVMIPDRRLLQLVEQALDLQREACVFHNSDVGETSLFTNHHCGRDQIPSQTIQILQEHQDDEVWYLQFSQNGKYLASSSSDNSAIIWEVGLDGKVSLKHRLIGHQKPVSSIAWSSEDDQILTCGIEEALGVGMLMSSCLRKRPSRFSLV